MPIIVVLKNIVARKNITNFEKLEATHKLVFDVEKVKNCTMQVHLDGVLFGSKIEVQQDYLIYSLELAQTSVREYCWCLSINPNHNKTQMRFLHIPTNFLGLPVVYSPSLLCYDKKVKSKDTSHLNLSLLNTATSKIFSGACYDVDLSHVIFTKEMLEKFFTLYPRTNLPFQTSGSVTFDITKNPVYVFYSFRFGEGFPFCPQFFSLCDISTWEGKGFSIIYVLEEKMITEGIVDVNGYHCLGNFKTYKESKVAVANIKNTITKEILHNDLMGQPYLKAIQYVTYKKYDG